MMMLRSPCRTSTISSPFKGDVGHAITWEAHAAKEKKSVRDRLAKSA